MIEMYLKSSVPVLDNKDNPLYVLGWDIVFTGQRSDTLNEYSMTGTITLDTPLDLEVPITKDMLMVYVDAFINEQGWEQSILDRLG